MSEAFVRGLAFVLRWEGGWSDHPQDPGGATMKGVTLATFIAWCAAQGRPKPDKATLKSISDADVEAIYRRNYWDACRCDQLPPALALLVFDMAVNAGPGRAARILQATVGATVDGAIGPQTLAKAAQAGGGVAAVVEFSARRGLHYGSLSTFKTFGLGWMRRCCDAEAAALALVEGAAG